MNFLEIKNINKSFKNKKILKDITLTIKKGEISSIFGYSGEGKSTLLSIICGLIKQDSGDILLKGNNINKMEPYERSISLVMDEPLLFPNMNIMNNIAFGLKLNKNIEKLFSSKHNETSIKRTVLNIMDILGISGLEKRYPNEISMGQSQRISLARAIVTNPEIILMDEPFSNLDIISKTKVRSLIKHIQKELKITILLVTHDIEDVMNLSDTMFILNNGHIQDSGNPKDILKKPSTMDTAYLLGTENIFEGKIAAIDKENNNIMIYFKNNGLNNEQYIESYYQQEFEENENVYFVIRPEDIIILREDRTPSKAVKENHFRGKITSAVFTSRMMDILIDTSENLADNIQFKVLLPFHAYEIMNLSVGKSVSISLKKSAIHIIKKKHARLK
ncbi:MAG: ABC transporter ATP-binding protein [Candidatus Acididesulfobacter guangdongensis]|uniref:ABC transporter ATP-binding protein n=1 Tax=Acididesulfobacter guangdongensis TaxID=2597225 RepID=A0A519BEE0_ACIG2|nr:MAG: ABC transporter ATP-binding protein [Candidatus Acididesulfobacter guangdongensis]